jgi:phospholipid N-methyltransferase
MKNKIEYIGKDLEAMDFAVNYHRWILEKMSPFLGKNLVEVGAGTGAFSELLLSTMPKTLSLVEPSEMFSSLQTNLQNETQSSKLMFFQDIFSNVADKIKTEQSPDSIIYINVLEHIEDDSAELQIINKTLCDKGRVLIFVPALPFLFSSFDRKIGHFRRYTKKDLEQKCRDAGFNLLLSRYFDVAGIFPWFLKYRLLNSTSMESSMVQLYDRLVVPTAKSLENFVPPPIGKNLLIVGEKA